MAAPLCDRIDEKSFIAESDFCVFPSGRGNCAAGRFIKHFTESKLKDLTIWKKPKYYITTAIAYASAKPHIGNTYEIIFTDAIARFKRQRGYDVFF